MSGHWHTLHTYGQPASASCHHSEETRGKRLEHGHIAHQAHPLTPLPVFLNPLPLPLLLDPMRVRAEAPLAAASARRSSSSAAAAARVGLAMVAGDGWTLRARVQEEGWEEWRKERVGKRRGV